MWELPLVAQDGASPAPRGSPAGPGRACFTPDVSKPRSSGLYYGRELAFSASVKVWVLSQPLPAQEYQARGN